MKAKLIEALKKGTLDNFLKECGGFIGYRELITVLKKLLFTLKEIYGDNALKEIEKLTLDNIFKDEPHFDKY